MRNPSRILIHRNKIRRYHTMLVEKLTLMVLTACHFSSAIEPTNTGRYHCTRLPIARCDCECRLPPMTKIVGGEEALPHEFPWLVAILTAAGSFLGGGTLITNKHVLTAAHIILNQKKGLTVIFGGHDTHNWGNELQVPVKVIKLSNSFKHGELKEDIAILVLKTSVPFGRHIQPACLPPSGPSNYLGMKGIVAGWGAVREKHLQPAKSLRKTTVPIVSIQKCNASYDLDIRNNMICAGYRDGVKDSCQGDSGGPLHIIRKSYLEIVGIVSFGRGCGRPNTPGVYTRVSSFIPWIQKSVGQECLCQLPLHK